MSIRQNNKMILRHTLALTLLFLTYTSISQNNIIELPVTLVDGYGKIPPGFAALGKEMPAESRWIKTVDRNLPGIPKAWKQVVVTYIRFDPQQFAFQNYKLGNLSTEDFDELRLSWNIDLDKRPFSEKPIKCFVYVAYGNDSNGQIKYMVDTNNNYDFSDETEYTPHRFDWQKIDSLVQNFSHKVRYESFRNGRIVQLTAPLLLVDIRGNGNLWQNIAQHGETEFQGSKILISSGGLTTTTYHPASICNSNSVDEMIQENEFIQIKNEFYEYLGVSIGKNSD